MRGAVSVALVYAYYDPDGTTTDRARSTLISMTLTVVLISTLVFGAVTKPLLDYMLGSKGILPESRYVLTCDCRMRRCIADQCLLSTTSNRPKEKNHALLGDRFPAMTQPNNLLCIGLCSKLDVLVQF